MNSAKPSDNSSYCLASHLPCLCPCSPIHNTTLYIPCSPSNIISTHNSLDNYNSQGYTMKSKSATALFALACVAGAKANPKIGSDDKGFLPSKNYLQSGDQLAMESAQNETLVPSASDKAGRFGFPTYTTDGQNYPQNVNNVVPGLYGPVKLDIGGLVLGTIVGLGAFFILPKLFHVLSSPYGGGYKRSEDEPSVGGEGVTDVYRRISKSLEAMNVDATSCLQRAICSSMQSQPSTDNAITSITKNDMVKAVLAGTDWDLALKVGSRGESCGSAFPKCPFTLDSVVKPLVRYLSS